MTGFELRLWRRGLGWTQERAAEEMGISLRTYISFERQSPSRIVELAALAIEMELNTGSKPDFHAWRQRLKFTQKGAAEALGISLRCYINYEKMEPPRTAVLAILSLEKKWLTVYP
jgi:DNA-binding XRE family transcriptional regulator